MGSVEKDKEGLGDWYLGAKQREWWGCCCAGLHCASLAILLTACGKAKSQPAPPPVTVQVVTVTPTNVPIYGQWIGTVEGYVNAEIRAQVSGYLLSQDYAEGSQVKKGQLLFRIDPRPFQAVLDQAKAKLAQDEAQQGKTQLDVTRLTPLAKVNAVSQEELDNAVQANLAALATVKADQALEETAQLNLSFTRITSPIDGLAGVAQAQIGDLVGPSGRVLTTISTIDPVKVYFNVSEQDYLAYRRHWTNQAERTVHEQELQLQLILADGSAYPHLGRFYFAGREVNPTTGTLLLTGLFANPDYVLRPGQFARVRAMTDLRKGALLVPQRAVTELQTSYQVALVDDHNKVHLQPVEVGPTYGSAWIIDKGLQPGERVIVEGVQKVKEGQVVNPQPFVWTTNAATNSALSAQR